MRTLESLHIDAYLLLKFEITFVRLASNSYNDCVWGITRQE